MENEQEQIKLNNYDINMLIGIYFLDQGAIQLNKLAEMIAVPEDKVAEVLAEYRQSPVYEEFYSEISTFSNNKLGKQDTELLSKCMGETVDLMNAFYVLSERKVSPSTILEEGHADKLLQSAYFREMFGQNLSALVQEEKGIAPGWKRLMAETALAQDYKESMQSMRIYTEFRRHNPEYRPEQEADFRQMVNEAYARAETSERNYLKVFEKPFVLPEAEKLRKLYTDGDEEKLLEQIRERKGDMLSVGQFADFLCGSPGRLNTGFDTPEKAISDRLAEALSQTVWFERMVGYDLSAVQPELMSHAQFTFAHTYAARLEHIAGGEPGLSVPGLSADGNEISVSVDMRNITERLNALVEMTRDRRFLETKNEDFVKGMADGVEADYFDSPHFKRMYGDDLSLVSGTLDSVDVMVMEQYRKSLESRAAELAADLAQNPSKDKLEEYRSYVAISDRLDVVTERMGYLYAPFVREVEKLTPDMEPGKVPDRAVMLLYEETTGQFMAVDAGTAMDDSKQGYSVIDRYTTLKEAIDFIRLADRKVEQSRSGILMTDSMKNEYKVYNALPKVDKAPYLSVGILSAELAAKSEHPDLAAMRAIAFEYEQKVAFDRVNPGVVDVIKTDENRAEYQEKTDRDSGFSKSEKTGGGRSV